MMCLFLGYDETDSLVTFAQNPPVKCLTKQPQILFKYDVNFTAEVGCYVRTKICETISQK